MSPIPLGTATAGGVVCGSVGLC